MSSESIYSSYHYTYRITNILTNLKYIGVHSCDWLPEKDIGVKYFSSSTDLEFLKEQREFPERFKYEVLMIWNTRREAELHERFLHLMTDVARSPVYYNRCNASMGFNTTGKVSVRDKDGKTMSVSVDDPKFLSGELIAISKNRVSVRDRDGNTMSVYKNDPRYISGELVHVRKGLVTVKDKDGNTMSVKIDDSKYLAGELVGFSKGTTLSEERKLKIGEEHKGTIVVKDKNGKTSKVSLDDQRYLSGELVYHLKDVPLSEEHKRKIGEKQKGKILSEEHKQKVKENHADCRGEKNSFFGRKHTEESKKKIGDRDYSSQSGENHFLKVNNLDSVAKGTKWYHDGTKTYMLQPDDPKIIELGLFPGRNLNRR